MNKVIVLVALGVLAWAATATADNIDLIAQPVYINPSGGGGGGGGGYADIETNIGFLVMDAGTSFTTDVALELDGIVYDTRPIVVYPYSAPGCEFIPDYMGQPSCVANPGCDEMLINSGQLIPGHCYYAGTQYIPFRCGCKHDYYVLWPHVQISGVGVLRLIIDSGNTLMELDEGNNVTILNAPVGIEPATWGVLKSMYR